MIEHLRGTILHKEPARVVLDAGGVGYGIEIPDRISARLGEPGAEARLWIHTIVREDDISLFGFEHRIEREAFGVCIGIGGFGPRVALSVLATFEVDELVRVVLRNDVRAMTRVPGIGTKKAEKLILELKDRVRKLSSPSPASDGAPGSAPAGPARSFDPRGEEAMLALEALGTPPPVARRAVERAIELVPPDGTVEQLVREALRHRAP